MSVGSDAKKLMVEKMNKARGIAVMYQERRAYMDALEIINQVDEVTVPVTTPAARALMATAMRGVVDSLTDDLMNAVEE